MNPHRLSLFALVLSCLALASESRSADPPLQKPSVLDYPPLVMVMRGDSSWLGDFDKEGNFIRDPNFPANYYRNGGSVVHRYSLASIGRNTPVYEHRSGRLIRGTSVDKPHSVFVPEVGSTVIDIAKFDLKKPDRIVWNLVQTVPAFWTEEREKQFPKGLPKGTPPLPCGIRAGWDFVPLSVEHPGKAGKQPKFARVIGDVVEFGLLSDEGEFVPDPDLPVVALSGIKGPRYNNSWNSPRYYTLPKLDNSRTDEDVYEYRSGRLIKGTLQKTGNFVPEIGSKILDFKDYDPLGRRRIYNLPGVLRKAK